MSPREAASAHGATFQPGDTPAFAEPWQAQAFAMVVALHERGVFSWSEWAEALSAEVSRPGVAQDGDDYYVRWLAALEKLLATKDVAAPAEVAAIAAAWQRAAHATPHGKPIRLENDPQSSIPLAGEAQARRLFLLRDGEGVRNAAPL